MDGGNQSAYVDRLKTKLDENYREEAYGLWLSGNDAQDASERMDIEEVDDETKLQFLEELFEDFDKVSLSNG